MTATIPYVLKHLKKRLATDFNDMHIDKCDQEGISPSDLGIELHTMVRIFRLSEIGAETYYRCLWGIPGMTDLLLSEPLTPLLEKKQKKKISEDGDENDSDDDDDYGYQQNDPISEYAYFIYNTLIHTATMESCLRKAPFTAVSEGRSPLRNTPLGQIAAKRAADLWITPGILQACGYALVCGVNLMTTLCETQINRLDYLKRDLVPTCLFELKEGDAGEYGKPQALLRLITREDIQQIAELSVLVNILLASYHYLVNLPDDFDTDDDTGLTDDEYTGRSDVVPILCRLVRFISERKDKFAELCQRIQFTSAHPIPGFPRHKVTSSTKAFFKYFQEQHSLEKRLSIVKAITKWDKVKSKPEGKKIVASLLSTEEPEGKQIVASLLSTDSKQKTQKHLSKRIKSKLLEITCKKCGKKPAKGIKFMKCGGCKLDHYCSTECQRKDWKTHKEKCKTPT